MSYVALYREWRPKTFHEIIGQEHITRTLKNQIEQGRISHAYLFCGTRGTGKTTTAKVFSKAVNCMHPEDGEPCGKCQACTGIDNGSLLDVIEMDAASNRRVENIRDLVDSVKLPPYKARYKVYIVDEVHMLTTEAFNTLLKTLEEPPAYAIFILATTEFAKVPATIVSRCQRFDFKRITLSDIVKRLRTISDEGGINVENKTLELIGRNSDGALRDGLSIFDQCISLGGKDVRYEDVLSMLGITTDEYLIKLSKAVADSDSAGCIYLIDELILNGKDINQFIKDLTLHFRNLLISRVADNAGDILNISEEMFEEFKAQSKKFSTESILRNINILSAAESDAKWVSQPRIILEMAVLRMCKRELDTDIDALIDRIARLEQIIASGKMIQDKGDNSVKAPLEDGAKKKARKVHAGKEQSKEADTDIHESPETSSNISLQDISRKWKDILKSISSGGHKRIYAFMLEGKPVGVLGSVLTVSFEKNYEFHKNGLEDPDNRRIAEEYISSACGSSMKLKCIIQDEVAVDSQEEDMLEKAISIFGEDLVEVEE